MQESLILRFCIRFIRTWRHYYNNSFIAQIIKGLSHYIQQATNTSKLVNFLVKDWNEEYAWENSALYKILLWPFNILKKLGKFIQKHLRESYILTIIRGIFKGFLSLTTRFFGLILLVALLIEIPATIWLKDFSLTPVVVKLILLAIALFLVCWNSSLKGLYEGSRVIQQFTKIIRVNLLKYQEDFLFKPFALNLLAVIVGIVLGLLAIIFPYTTLIKIIVAVTGVLLVLWKTEIGLFLIVAFVAFLPTMAMAGLIILTFVSFIIRLIIEPSFKLRSTPLDLLILMFCGLLIYGSVTSFALTNSIQIAAIYIVFIMFYFLFTNTIKTYKQLYSIIALFLLAGLLVALYGIYQYVTGDVGNQVWIDQDMFSDIEIRVYSTFANPNVLGEYLLLLIPMALGFVWAAKRISVKAVFAIISVSLVLCLILTFSRGCWLGLILALAIFVLFVDRRLIFLGVIGLFILPFILPETVIERFTSIGNLRDTSSSYRLFIWLGTINMLKDYWISGIGLGTQAFNRVYPLYSYSAIVAPHSHNLYLQLLSEMGILGLIVFCGIMIMFFKTIISICFKSSNRFLKIFLISTAAGMAGYLLQGVFDNVWYNYRVFLIFWMILSFAIAGRNIEYNKMEVNND